jgi:hypothetical protein
MKIVIETIPHDRQRYDTVGDWWVDPDGTLQLRVSEMADLRYERLVALHELVEFVLCDDQGISEEVVSAFDKGFEAHRPDGNTDEPGDDPGSPYHVQHGFATAVERMVAAALEVSWKEYDAAVMAL